MLKLVGTECMLGLRPTWTVCQVVEVGVRRNKEELLIFNLLLVVVIGDVEKMVHRRVLAAVASKGACGRLADAVKGRNISGCHRSCETISSITCYDKNL